ncbi:MAG: hypothetical protein U9Q21_02620 [Candidatus Auribacterota bacterium]|nr:hypothetical protein [Candidatus Auribacterota bacterium]
MQLLISLNAKNPAYERGDIISLHEDGAEWGNLECTTIFLVVKLDGVIADHVYLINSLIENEVIMKKRTYYIEVDNLFSQEELDSIHNSEWNVQEIQYSDIKDKADL